MPHITRPSYTPTNKQAAGRGQGLCLRAGSSRAAACLSVCTQSARRPHPTTSAVHSRPWFQPPELHRPSLFLCLWLWSRLSDGFQRAARLQVFAPTKLPHTRLKTFNPLSRVFRQLIGWKKHLQPHGPLEPGWHLCCGGRQEPLLVPLLNISENLS